MFLNRGHLVEVMVAMMLMELMEFTELMELMVALFVTVEKKNHDWLICSVLLR